MSSTITLPLEDICAESGGVHAAADVLGPMTAETSVSVDGSSGRTVALDARMPASCAALGDVLASRSAVQAQLLPRARAPWPLVTVSSSACMRSSPWRSLVKSAISVGAEGR